MSSLSPRCIVHAAENIKGGVGTYLRDMLAAQRDSFGAGVVVAIVPESQCGILEAPAGVELVTFDNRGPRWLSALRLARQTREVLARRNPSVVHLHSTFAGLALRPLVHWMALWRKPRPPIVYCAHGWAFDRETSLMSRCLAMGLERMQASLCDAIVCISAHEVNLARRAGIPADQLIHIPNGIPRDAPLPPPGLPDPQWPPGKLRVLFVGRFDRQKGVDLLAAAMAELGDSAFALIVGDSVLGDGVSLQIPPNARTTGWVPAAGLAVYYKTADVLVVPSRWEGFGLIAAEAMRAGLPVIATRVGGLVEIVDPGVTGLLVEPGSPRALVSALKEIAVAPRKAMGEFARERFLRYFTLDRAHAQVTSLYQRLLTPPAAARADSAHMEGSTNA